MRAEPSLTQVKDGPQRRQATVSQNRAASSLRRKVLWSDARGEVGPGSWSGEFTVEGILLRSRRVGIFLFLGDVLFSSLPDPVRVRKKILY